MNIRRSAALVAATVVIGAVSASAAVADGGSPSPSAKVVVPSGLYGTSDPTYDGVWRQSLAFIAQDTVGVHPATKAVDWLAGQQCADGGFAAFRAEPNAACDKKVQVDSNSTAAAVQALAAVGGHDSAVTKGADWLKKNQNADGGWSYSPGGASDANSTSVVLGALAAAGDKGADVKAAGGKNGLDALASLALPCSQGKNGGALAYQPDKKGKLAANADATAAGVLGALGSGFTTGKGDTPDAYTCESGKDADALAHNGAVYLQNQLSTHLYLNSQLAGAEDQPDYGNTADAVTSVAAAEGIKYTKDPYAWLEKNAQDWAKKSGPGAYAQLIFAAHATGNDPHDFGGTDLVSALNRTGPDPASAKSSAADSSDHKKDSDNDSGIGTWWIVGVMFIAAVGAGILISGRKKQQL